MVARDLIQSPIVVGRDEFLALSVRRLEAAAQGRGGLLFVAGEAGIGKTRMLGAITRQAQLTNFGVLRAGAFPGDVQSSAGLLLDLAGDLLACPQPPLRELGGRLSARLREITGQSDDPTTGDAHRRRRLLVQDLVDLLLPAYPGNPLLIVLEDLHWADEVSLDVLGRLATRLGTRPLLVAAAYRSDELYPDRPIRELRARLLGQRLAEELRLPRLELDQTATMIGTLLGRPAPAQVVQALQERSDGIPLHIEEFLAAVDSSTLTVQSGAGVQAATVPDTLGDAVLSRVARLPARTREVATAASVIGRSFDFDLLTAITEAEPGEVAAALRRLTQTHLIVPGTDSATFDFRHALIRDALYADTDLYLRRRLHERVAHTATERGYRGAFISAHLEQAGLRDLAYRQAFAAGDLAASISAHREALELYRRAARNEPPGLPVPERARLLAAVGDEAAAMDDNSAAAAAYRSAHQLISEAGDRKAAAALIPRMVAVGHLLGDGLEIRIRTLQAAMDSLDGVSDAGRERVRLRSAMADAYMLARCLDEAIEEGERSRSEGPQTGGDEADLNLAATLGSVLVFAGRLDEGWKLLEEAISQARDTHREADAARGYRMLSSSASVLVDYDRAEPWLAEGIRYAEKVELWNHQHYLGAHLAHVQWATGDWERATGTAEHALADGRGGITTEITAQYVLGYLALGRGDWAEAEALLLEAQATGERMAELQRLSPPLWGLAEAARCRGDHGGALALCERGYQASAEVTDAAYLFPYLLTGVRAHLALGDAPAAQRWFDSVAAVLRSRAIPGTLPAIEQAQGLLLLARGDLAAAERALTSAREAWQARRRFWEGAWAGLDLATVAVRARRRAAAIRILDETRRRATAVGATVLVRAADELARSFDRGRPVQPWHPLSAREFQVAQLVAAGLTNRQIAERLVLAPKTISAHVEHILLKLGAARRTEIAAWCSAVPRADVPRS
jgi:ATP/maltotriose-dependent transcriptional regulator MalT